MKCSEFELILPDFLEGELGGCGNSEALSHIKECKKCNDMLQEIIAIRKQFNRSFDYSNIEFSSRKKEIIESIDKNKYIRKKSNLKRNVAIITSVAAMVVGVVTFSSYIKSYLIDNIQVESINDIGKGRDDNPLIRSSLNIRENIYTEMRKAVDEKLNTIGDVVIKNKNDIYEKVKSKDEIIWSITNKDDFCVFRNDNYVFGYDKKNKKYYGFCDMNKVANSNTYKVLFGTEDGRFIFFGDFTGTEEGIYIVDLITDKVNYIPGKYSANDWTFSRKDNEDSFILISDKRAIEFKDLKKGMEYKEYNEQTIKEIFNKDITIGVWNEILTRIPKDVYSNELTKDDKIIYYKNKRLYVERKDKVMEITKNNSEVLEGILPNNTAFYENNIIACDNKSLDVINMDTKVRYAYDTSRDIKDRYNFFFRMSYNGDFIIDLKEDKEWVEAKFPKGENREPLKLIEKKSLNQKSLVDVDNKGRVIIVSGLDKDNVFNIKMVKVK